MPTDISPDSFSAKFAVQLNLLKKQFVANLECKEQDLEGIIANVALEGLQAPILSDLFTIAHNLAGSAPMHGFHEVAKQAAAIEELILQALHTPHNQISDMDVMLAIDDLSELIRTTLETCQST